MFSQKAPSLRKFLKKLIWSGNCHPERSDRHYHPQVEELENRYLPAAVINEFPIPTPSSGAIDITYGPDGNLWFAEESGHKIGRITPSGTITEYAVSGDPVDMSECAGSGSDVWFAEFDANLVGKIDTSTGVVTEYDVPTANAGPDGITQGADGNEWFAEYNVGQIGCITSAGQITEYAVGGNPTDLTLGPDGNVWFTSYNTDQVGKITPSGSATLYSVPSGSGPAGIAAGPDGNLWVTCYNTSQVDRITTSGNITEFRIPTANSHPWAINPSTDGTLWFAESTANQIGRISTSGLFREYAIPTADSDPRGIAIADDGSAWFTEYGGNQIGQIIASATPSINLNVNYGSGRTVTLSGQVTDDDPGGITVTFSGQVVGTVVTNPDGTFTGTFQATGLGTVFGTVTNGLGFSATVSILLTSNAPVISDFSGVASPLNTWVFTGTATDESAPGLIVQFGGLPSLQGQTATVQANGTFSLVVELQAGEEGTASAQVTDAWGLVSNLALFVVAV